MTLRAFDDQLSDLALEQHGVVARWQLLDESDTRDRDRVDHRLDRRLKNGRLRRVEGGVYVLAGASDTWHQRLWTLLLATGPGPAPTDPKEKQQARGALSHQSAGQLWQLRYSKNLLVVTVRHPLHITPAKGRVRQSTDLAPHHVTNLDGLAVTTCARTVCDLARLVRPQRLGHLLDTAVATKNTTYNEVGSILGSLLRQGKRGLPALAVVLDDRQPGASPPQSELEYLLLDVVRGTGLRRPELQYPFPGRMPGAAYVDAAYPEAQLIIEADGRRWHQRAADMRRDRARDNAASRAGWLTLRFLYEDLTTDTKDAARTLTETYAVRRRQLAA